MWDVAVVVVQIACVALLIVGAALSFWISWARPARSKPVGPSTLAVVKTAANTELKRAA